ncbi:hypothetical protein A9Q84_17485 [Halobacteriovorax marinus]|uniref:Lipoprotein n=1 Tax=Halobacteriovorax marinus TaxID=97084 RepID=A0A1Y5F3M0_9BACT|nr:hypothetical protein A9Q84_17485 [Halobacteriovorax marinus]
MNKIFLVLSFLLLSSCATSIHDYSHRDPASSANLRDCRDSARAFIAANPTKSGPIRTGENSLATKIPNFENFRSEMLNKRPSMDKFTKIYQDSHGGQSPKVKDALDFFVTAHQDLASHIRSGKGHSEELDHYLEMSAAHIDLGDSKLNKISAFRSDESMRDLFNTNFDLRKPEQRRIFDSLGWTNYKGHLGELDVLLRLGNLQAQGVYLVRQNLLNPKSQVVNDIFATALEQKLARLSVEQIPQLMQKYPKVFKNLDNLSNDEVLRRAKTFLETKEFDLIVKKHNRYSVVEVKNYKKPISRSEVSAGRGRNKTIFDQQLETIQIIRFLGLEETFFPTVAFLRGVTPEAKAILEREGISVLAEVVE